jgi:hypothetical protein
MAGTRYVLAVAAMALVAACTTNQRLESSRGTAIRIVDDIDALEAAVERADNHCDGTIGTPCCKA